MIQADNYLRSSCITSKNQFFCGPGLLLAMRLLDPNYRLLSYWLSVRAAPR